jgi:hypothetical protein
MLNKKEQLKEKVVNLVKEFVETEGGITVSDLQALFGESKLLGNEVAAALAGVPISFNG